MILRGSVYSKILEMETGIAFLLPRPPDAGRPAKVAYLLHGLGGNSGSWLDRTLLSVYAKEKDILFVMPEVGRSFYTDMKYGQRFFSYIADELPDICARTFRISAERADTAVFGGSMGGYGALKVALSRPERYGFCCPIASACLYLGEQIEEVAGYGSMEIITQYLGAQLVRDFQAILGTSFAVGDRERVTSLARAVPPELRPRIYSACGAEDDLARINRRFRDEMAALGYAITYEEWAGGHDWLFFDGALRRGLESWLGTEKT